MSYPQHTPSAQPNYGQQGYQQRPQGSVQQTGSYQAQQPYQHHQSYQQPPRGPQHAGSYQQQHSYQQPATAQSYAPQQGNRPPQRDNWAQQLYQQVQPQQIQQLKQWFLTVDRDRSGTIEAQELQEVTFDNKKLGWECAASLLKVFDKDRNGSIDFNEYVSLHQFILVVRHVGRNAFIKSDADRSGRIEAKEIHAALSLCGFNYITFDTTLELLLKFDKTRTGLSWTEYLMLAAHIAHARAMFQYNDHNNSGQIRININQFIQLMSYLT